MKIPMMNAVRFDGTDVRLEEIRRVRPAAGEVLVRVLAVAVDRRDGEPSLGPYPLSLDRAGRRTLGRHVAGTVAALGVGVDGWPLGRSLVVQPEVLARGRWFAPGVCADGGLAEYLVAPVEALVPLPRHLSAAEGAQLALAARAGSLLAHARLMAGESVGIWGAGSLGSAAVAVARALGAAPVIALDPRPQARIAARELGADADLDPAAADVPARVHELTEGRGLDVALHLAPHAGAAEQSVAGLSPQGRGVLIGPVEGVGGAGRWDGRTLSGLPRVAPGVLPGLIHLLNAGRLRLPVLPPALPGGLPDAVDVLGAAVGGESSVAPCVLTL